MNEMDAAYALLDLQEGRLTSPSYQQPPQLNFKIDIQNGRVLHNRSQPEAPLQQNVQQQSFTPMNTKTSGTADNTAKSKYSHSIESILSDDKT